MTTDFDPNAPTWYVRHRAARGDTFRSAQNVADQTGLRQQIVSLERVGDHDIMARIEWVERDPDERRPPSPLIEQAPYGD